LIVRALPLVVLALVAGCSKSGSLVFVTVDAAAPIADAARMHVALAAGGTSRSSDLTLTPSTFPPPHSFAVDLSPGVTGSLGVQVTVFDSSGADVGESAGSVDIAAGARADLSLTLGAFGAGDLGAADLAVADLAGTTPADLAWHALTWTPKQIGAAQMTAMWASDATHGWVCGDSSANCFFSAGDDVWPQKSANPFYRPGGMWGTSSTVLFFVGNNGDIRGWDNANNTWIQSAANVSSGATLTGIWGTSINDVYVTASANSGAAGEFIYHNVSGNLTAGTGWSNPLAIASGGLNGVSGTTGHTYAVGNGGRIFHSSDGSVWNPLTTGVPAVDLHGVFVLDATHVYVVGDAGTILFSSGNGMFIKQTIAATYATFAFRAIWAADADNVFAVGDKGAVLHGDSAGTWIAETSGLEVQTANINTVFGTSATNVYVAGDSGWVSHGK